MAKQMYNRTKPHVNIGTIGHIDHGKTTLGSRSVGPAFWQASLNAMLPQILNAISDESTS